MTADRVIDIGQQFHPKQWLATQAADNHKYTLFGGARGPGKSYWLRWWLLRFLLMCNAHVIRGVRVGLFCETFKELTDRQVSKIQIEFPPEIGILKESKAHGLAFHLNSRLGSGVIALRNLDDPSKYQSTEFAAIGVDELTKNKLSTFNLLRGSLRWPGIRNTRFVAGTNPGSIGHLWVKDYWINKKYPPELQGLADQFAFVSALPDDNPSLDQSYWDELNTLPPDLARAWRWGDWDVFEGQAFGEWRRDLHVIPPFQPPENWRKLRGIDWGRVKPFCCLWGAQDPDTGRVIIYRELYETGLTDRQQAKRIREMSRERIAVTHADPSMWVKKSHQDEVFSTADEYQAVGVPLSQADNSRVPGKNKVSTMLAELAPDGKPLLQITESCPNLIRTLPALPRDKANVEDVDSDAEDHAYDACRYLLSDVNPRPKYKPPVVKPKAYDRIEHLLNRQRVLGGVDL